MVKSRDSGEPFARLDDLQNLAQEHSVGKENKEPQVSLASFKVIIQQYCWTKAT